MTQLTVDSTARAYYGISSDEISTQTASKIKSFNKLNPGWHYGEGGPIKDPIITEATDLLRYILGTGFKTTDAFPGLNGEIMITVYQGDEYFEITLEADSTITFLRERNNIEIDYQEGLDNDNLKELIENLWNELWTSSGLSVAVSGTSGYRDLIASHSPTQVLRQVYQLSRGSVSLNQGARYVPI